jgi:predicted lysophospholipase L1 biosynthesis ABC-type transport system permease subunit
VTRFLLQRVRAHRLLVAAALLTTLLVTSVLAALAAFATTLGDTGVRRSLDHRSAARTVLSAGTDTPPADPADAEHLDQAVRAAAEHAYSGLPTTVARSTRSGSYALPDSLRPPGAAAQEQPDLTLFASFDPGRVEMVAGRWPQPASPQGHGERVQVQVAVAKRVADRLGLAPGDTIAVTGRLDDTPSATAHVTGVYRPKDPDAPYWTLDPLGGDGVRNLAFTTYGPLAVAAGSFGPGLLAPAETHWLADADYSTVTADRLDALRSRMTDTVGHFDQMPGIGAATAESELPDVIDGLQRTLQVSRSTVLIAALQLVVLAALALLLVARLLSTERENETALLAARGASRRRIIGLAAAESLLLALPGLVAAPLLAGPAVRLLMSRGPLADAGTEAAVQLPPSTWWVAAGTALACAVTMTLPSLRAGTELKAPRRKAATMLRGGMDGGLLVLAGVAYWQLTRRSEGTGVLATGASALGVDPVLVAAPALALLAGTVLALRLLPPAARLGEHRASRSRGLSGALAGWQLSRRPGRGAGPALLLVLAVAMGVFAVGQGASWDRSQGDQAAFRTGSDILVDGLSAPPYGQGGLVDGVDGVAGTAPVARDEFAVQGETTTQVLATDTRAAAGVIALRDDLTDTPLPDLLRPLSEDRERREDGVALPEGTTALRLHLRATDEGDTGDVPPTDVNSSRAADLTLTVEDRFGVPYSFLVGGVSVDGHTHTRTVHLGDTAGSGSGSGAPAAPVRLTRLTLSYVAPSSSHEIRLTIPALDAVAGDGTAQQVTLPDGQVWSSRFRSVDSQHALGSGGRAAPEVHSAKKAASGGPLTLSWTTGSAPAPLAYRVEPVPVDLVLRAHAGNEPAPGVLPAVATDAFLAASGAKVGDDVKVPLAGTELTVHLTGSLHALPTVTPPPSGQDGGGLLVDLAALDHALLRADSRPLPPDGWWVATEPGSTAKVADRLRSSPVIESVLVRDELAEDLRADPLNSGARTALTAIAVAAAVLAATGFAVSTAGAARERAGEFAVLRALGASQRRLARVLAVEQGTLVLMSLVVGLLLGVLLTRLVVPLIVLTGQATRPVPELIVHLPPGRLTLLLAGVLAVPVLLVLATALRRTDPVSALRTEREG